MDILKELERTDARFGETAHKEAIRKIVEYHDAPEEFMQQLVTFSSTLKNGRYKALDYIRAVQYCTYRQMNKSMTESYRLTFPDRLEKNGKPKPKGTIEAAASIYDKTALVQGILSQVQIPLHIMMMPERVKAANVLAYLMMNAENERVQMEAADKLLNHINVPETHKIELDVGFKADETLQELNGKLDALANMAQKKIEAGIITPVQVIES